MNRFEHRSEPLLPRAAFQRRLLRHVAYVVLLVAGSIVMGTVGFWRIAHQAPITAFLNTAMLLGGMGPVGDIESDRGKIFAAVFALYAGLVFLVIAGLLAAPVAHRILHKFHLEDEHRRKGH